ncbi:MAG TPA: Smr/MutS family protein [Deltaproteobacteria bacterium]|nr:Smr/MutS family protein [Deltaproteobacteria bacterium]
MGQDPLEYSILKQYLASHVTTDMGRSALEGLAPLDSWDEARHRLALVSEMMDALKGSNPPVVVEVPDVRALLSVREGAVLEGQDLRRISDAVRAVTRLKKDLEARGGLLAELARPVNPPPAVASQIEALILPTGEVSGDACPLLRDLRNKARSIRGLIVERLEAVLERLRPKSVIMEDLVTIRNERYVIPLRHDFHLHVSGITHDYSRTNRTVYVEPMEVVEENNALNQVRSQILEEEQRVLRELTSMVVSHASEIMEGLEFYGRFDLLAATAGWALRWGCTVPRIGAEGVDLKDARHPVLLERLGERATVPIDIRIPKGHDCLVITGPNAGGKTVALKTLGLLVLMAKSGLAVPAREGSTIAPFGAVHVEMDTSQDITHDLSSFTAHALTLKGIYGKTQRGDLVLLDEPGSGTDHEQGSALAVACIHALREKGATVVVTSHADLVKLYGVTSKGVQNAATAFDETGLKPLYTLQYGMVGQSRAFEILESIDFPRELIEQARGIVNRDTSSTLARAVMDMTQAHVMREEASRELAEARRMREEAARELEAHRKERLQSALRYKNLLDRLEKMAKRKAAPEEVRRVREDPETAEVERVIEEAGAPAEALDVSPGARVRLKGSDTEGVVVGVDQDSAEVSLAGKRVRVGLDQVTAVPGAGSVGGAGRTVSRMQAPPRVLPIKVVGLRVDEALPVVERAVDRAVLTGQRQLEIIHGAGTGRLKNAIRAYLRELPCVKAVEDAPMSEGGGNKTIVTLEGE